MNYEEAIDNLNNKFLLCPIDCAEDCEACRIEAVQLAIKALEKQIPKKPTYTGEKNVYGAVVRICNECGDKVCISPMAKEYENYCRSCGKRLTDWSEVQDEID